MIYLSNNESLAVRIEDTTGAGAPLSGNTTTIWDWRAFGSSGSMTFGPPNLSFRFALDEAGNGTFRGTVTQLSTEDSKIIHGPSGSILPFLRDLTIYDWSPRATPSEKHIGPLAEDFHLSQYGRGHGPPDSPGNGPPDNPGNSTPGMPADNKLLAPSDVAGVAALAAQEILAMVEDLQARVENLEAELLP
jgi:hypothetical protein